MNPLYRILIVEDHPAFLIGVTSVFEKDDQFTVVGTASTGKEAITMTDQLTPDLVITDIYLPDTTGLEVIRAIREHHPTLPIMILSNADEGNLLLEAFESGASGYLSKSSSLKQINESALEVLKGNFAVQPTLQKELIQQIKHKKNDNNPFNSLTHREKEVLFWLKEGLLDRDIAEKECIQTGTVRSHVANIMMKLHCDTRSQMVIAVLEHLQQNPDYFQGFGV